MQVSKFRFSLLMSLIVILVFAVGFTVTAQDVTLGEIMEGQFAGEPIAYSVDAAAGQLIVVAMESEDIDAEVYIEQDGSELARDDDSGADWPNALLAYVAQADGSFDIFATDSSFTPGEGAYTITIHILDPAVATIGGEATMSMHEEGSSAAFAVFEAAAGDVVDVWGITSADEDVEITLYGVDGVEIDSDDDDGHGDNALIRRAVLSDDGLYLVKVAHSWDDPLFEDATVRVDASEVATLTAEAQEMVLGDAEGFYGTEVFTIDMEAGKTYRFSVTIPAMPDEDAGILMELYGTSFFFDPEMEVQHSTGVTWDFLAHSTGTVILDIHPNFFGQDISSLDYTISMEVIE